MSPATTVWLNEGSNVRIARHEGSSTAFSNPKPYFENTVLKSIAGESVSNSFKILVQKPNELTEQVFKETDNGEDITIFESVRDLIDDLES